MIVTTSDLEDLDRCDRLAAWGKEWEYETITIHSALYKSVEAGLTAEINPGLTARNHFMTLARYLDSQSVNIYAIAVHHAHLAEVLVEYLRGGEGPWVKPEPLEMGSDIFQPDSFLMPDNRLRRVILTGNWSKTRKLEEQWRWRTVADTSLTNRPMLLNVIIIGSSRDGFRSTPWTRGFKHPKNGSVKTCRVGNQPFAKGWKIVFRENAQIDSGEWLRLMQEDGAFGQLVESFTVEPFIPVASVQTEVKRFSALKNGRMRRSGCFNPDPCQFLNVCWKGSDPGREGFTQITQSSAEAEQG